MQGLHLLSGQGTWLTHVNRHGLHICMPWMETDKTELRRDFVFLASKPGANKRELMRREWNSILTYAALRKRSSCSYFGLNSWQRLSPTSVWKVAPMCRHGLLRYRFLFCRRGTPTVQIRFLKYVVEILILFGKKGTSLRFRETLALEENFNFLTGCSNESSESLIYFLNTGF